MNFNYTIVGSGPCGLAIAYILSCYNKSVLVVDREESVGGCHKVKRVDKYFTEHGPRIYSSSYKNVISLLDNMGLNFYDYMTEYNFGTTTVIKDNLKHFTVREMATIVYEFFKMIISDKYSKSVTCLEFMKSRNFTDNAVDAVDRMCRLVGGNGAIKYTLYGFLRMIDDNMFHSLYQLTKPTDVGLFKDIKQILMMRGVKFIVSEVVSINAVNNKITSLSVRNKKTNQFGNLPINKCILAIPPVDLVRILSDSATNIKDAFGPLDKVNRWSLNNRYTLYIPVVFHWKEKLPLNKIYGSPKSDWGVEFIVLSDYMKFDIEGSKTVISTSITKPDGVSKVLKKTPHQCTEEELIEEVFRQIKTVFLI